jgi:hypothetical protein
VRTPKSGTRSGRRTRVKCRGGMRERRGEGDVGSFPQLPNLDCRSCVANALITGRVAAQGARKLRRRSRQGLSSRAGRRASASRRPRPAAGRAVPYFLSLQRGAEPLGAPARWASGGRPAPARAWPAPVSRPATLQGLGQRLPALAAEAGRAEERKVGCVACESAQRGRGRRGTARGEQQHPERRLEPGCAQAVPDPSCVSVSISVFCRATRTGLGGRFQGM